VSLDTTDVGEQPALQCHLPEMAVLIVDDNDVNRRILIELAKTFDRQALLDRVAGDEHEQLMDDFIRIFLQDCAQQLTAIRGAVDQKSP
jgi:CheY-like chemotaxis protein